MEKLNTFPTCKNLFIKIQQLFIFRTTWSSQHDKNTVTMDQQAYFYWNIQASFLSALMG